MPVDKISDLKTRVAEIEEEITDFVKRIMDLRGDPDVEANQKAVDIKTGRLRTIQQELIETCIKIDDPKAENGRYDVTKRREEITRRMDAMFGERDQSLI